MKLGVNEAAGEEPRLFSGSKGEESIPFVEEASRAEGFYLSFHSAGTLSSAFGWCLGIDVWNVMQQGGGKFKSGWKMETRRSWPK